MSDFETDQGTSDDLPQVRELTKVQRRVLGTLVEKAFTVPESYPMTLKGLTVGCNQKSNRSPVTNYTEDAVLDALDELRKMGLVAVVHTESGRTERYRHYVRKRFPFSEPQLAIMTELLLRGRQQMGELRARASRMVPIESLDDLRKEVEGLIAQNFVSCDGPLERRGVEVDHCFYLSTEQPSRPAYIPGTYPTADEGDDDSGGARTAISESVSSELNHLKETVAQLQNEIQELRAALEDVKDDLAQLRQSLGA